MFSICVLKNSKYMLVLLYLLNQWGWLVIIPSCLLWRIIVELLVLRINLIYPNPSNLSYKTSWLANLPSMFLSYFFVLRGSFLILIWFLKIHSWSSPIHLSLSETQHRALFTSILHFILICDCVLSCDGNWVIFSHSRMLSAWLVVDFKVHFGLRFSITLIIVIWVWLLAQSFDDDGHVGLVMSKRWWGAWVGIVTVLWIYLFQ